MIRISPCGDGLRIRCILPHIHKVGVIRTDLGAKLWMRTTLQKEEKLKTNRMFLFYRRSKTLLLKSGSCPAVHCERLWMINMMTITWQVIYKNKYFSNIFSFYYIKGKRVFRLPNVTWLPPAIEICNSKDRNQLSGYIDPIVVQGISFLWYTWFPNC